MLVIITNPVIFASKTSRVVCGIHVVNNERYYLSAAC